MFTAAIKQASIDINNMILDVIFMSFKSCLKRGRSENKSAL